MSDNNRDRETTIIETRRGGSGTLIAVILLIVVLGVLFYLFGDQLIGTADQTDIKVDVSAPTAPANPGS